MGGRVILIPLITLNRNRSRNPRSRNPSSFVHTKPTAAEVLKQVHLYRLHNNYVLIWPALVFQYSCIPVHDINNILKLKRKS